MPLSPLEHDRRYGELDQVIRAYTGQPADDTPDEAGRPVPLLCPNRAFRWPPLQRQLLSSRPSHRVASVRRAGARSRRPHRTCPPPQHRQDMALQPSHPALPLASGLLQIGCRMWSGGCSPIAGPQVTSVRSLAVCLGVSLAETGTGAV
ncbi:hypothetical protein FNV65_12550 [Streptomyces sp. S1A1-8]|nr:hypothetical protein FNV58_14105 [Streptomyces sp. RLB1-9]QDO18679.1 hypothetical protein FNV65_12550 [Streptomyces sp. S1A1-8]QDO28807.1 hypothetical protein FNV63_12570 [Streptomyces sp. S1A1-3]